MAVDINGIEFEVGDVVKFVPPYDCVEGRLGFVGGFGIVSGLDSKYNNAPFIRGCSRQ